jgi:hypothetical protein
MGAVDIHRRIILKWIREKIYEEKSTKVAIFLRN